MINATKGVTRENAIVVEMRVSEDLSLPARSAARTDAGLRRRFRGRATRLLAVAVVLGYALTGCSGVPADLEADKPTQTSAASPAARTESGSPAPVSASATAAPPWLGMRVLPVGPQGFASAQKTPPELRNRSIVTVDDLPPPADGRFHATVQAVPADVLARSSWTKDCPIAAADLRYITVGFRGFDGRAHTGELLANARVADDLVTVFEKLFAAGFPIERMRISSAAELNAPPTGDDNTTEVFACRAVRGRKGWSQHAHGLAVDLNPFQNPYRKGKVVLPELATAYLDRADARPGMAQPREQAVQAFAAIGWKWGGDYRSLKDYMHFSATGG
ncbi:M15 family metallopeptidase [Catellatospora sichuanensis]|uniref:M15 family metallopeptidase n=1 Tax=Catellatospora sichuanensis TaxID=1969805 RepID=UPI001FE69CE9|nr:M15 family metallopeptidase [Catellatospora sichuanensis]